MNASSRILPVLLSIGPFAIAAGAQPVAVSIVPAPPVPVPVCQPVDPANPAPAKLTPWFYDRDNGSLQWGRHEFWEDPPNTAFILTRDLVTLDHQTGVYPEALFFNVAHFDPPEGIDTGQPRRVMFDSIWVAGLQLYVNYSDRTIDATQGNDKYFNPTFFLSIDGHFQNVQTVPTVPWSGFSFQTVSATRGAFGCIFTQVTKFTSGACDDLYVTAGLPYGLADLDPDPNQQAIAVEAQRDRLMFRDLTDPDKRWYDASQEVGCPGGAPRIPAAAAAGNSSGVVFADLNGDGWADLYLGKLGDNYLGAQNVLLINDGTGCFTDQTAARIPGEPSAATNEVAALDLEGDGDLDLAVANRCRRTGTCGAESEDYVLVNDGTGHFAVAKLNPGLATDSRSVAAGDLNHDGWPELVFGNAGSDGFSNSLTLAPGSEDHPMQILFNWGALGGTPNTFLDATTAVLGPGTEPLVTRPLTQQVQLVDLFSPGANVPDGWLDLVIVNSRDILKDGTAFGPSGLVEFMVNGANWGGGSPFMFFHTAFGIDWVKAVAVADFVSDPHNCAGQPCLDVLEGRGNRFDGVQAELHKNLGPSGPVGNPWDFGGGFIDTKSYETIPGTERGYGLDFADTTGDGHLEAIQTSRGYNFLVADLFDPFGGASHHDLALSFYGTGATHNWRGRLQPKGMEDAVFADFDLDGDVDALLASQRNPSVSWPAGSHGSATPDTILLVNFGGGAFGSDFSGNPNVKVNDARIDLNGRVNDPSIADRAVAGDLDNDGDVDAFVHLFELNGTGPFFGSPATNSFFGRYLENVGAGGPGFWLKDVAATKLRDSTGLYSPNWNRGLGMDVLADFDNNGALDLYDTVGFAKQSFEVGNVAQTYDLLFLNGVGGQPVGVLTESGATKLPAPCQDVVQDVSYDPQYISCGSFGLAQGDLDNDGDADVVVTHYSQSGRTNYPWLLVNRLNEATAAFTDEYTTRVPIASLSPTIHTPSTDVSGVPNHTLGMDFAMFPAIFDLDGDGDNDIVLEVVNDMPRVLRNLGQDTNGDGVINAADGSPLGTFADATDQVLAMLKPTTDSQDLLPIDIDGDGDYDLVNDPFSDKVTIWRNDLEPTGLRPVVTEAWPRVGTLRGKTIRLHGFQLNDVAKVELRFAGGAVCNQTVTTPVPGFAGTQLDVVIPTSCPKGLAQIRLLRSWVPAGCANRVTRWSRQYFGYFVLG